MNAATPWSQWRWKLKAIASWLIVPALCFAVTLTPPAGTEFKQPQVALGRQVVAVTFGSPGTLWFSASHDGGKTFDAPSKVATPNGLMLGMHRGPRIVVTERAIVISAITTPDKGGTGNLTAWRSTDHGKTWSAPATVNDQARSAREGLHAMAAGPDGALFAAWLDDRDGVKKLVGSRSTDGGVTWSKNQVIYQSPERTICECCHPSLAINGDGVIFAMFRNALKGSRDMYMAISRDRGQTFKTEKLGKGTWQLNACPMDGGGITVPAIGGAVDVVFRRGDTIYVDEPGEPEVELAKGKNPTVAGSHVFWTAADGLHALRDKTKPALLDPKGAYPAAAFDGTRTFAAWESAGTIVITDKLP